MATALDPNLIQVRGKARVGCCDMYQSSHDQRVPADLHQYSHFAKHDSDTHCTCTALLIVPVVVLGGRIPTNALSKSPRSKFTAPRPEFGGASSCQHSRRAVLFAAEIAVILKDAGWLATPFAKESASTVIFATYSIVIFSNVQLQVRKLKREVLETYQVKYEVIDSREKQKSCALT
jgi:hypothetical protein